MSTTYSLVCDECHERHWAGQGDHLYDTAVMFMQRHLGHSLRFFPDAAEDYPEVDYREVKRDILETGSYCQKVVEMVITKYVKK